MSLYNPRLVPARGSYIRVRYVTWLILNNLIRLELHGWRFPDFDLWGKGNLKQ